MEGFTQHFLALGGDSANAGQQALGALSATVRREAWVMAFGDCLFIVGVVLLAMIPLVWFCRPAKGSVVGPH